MSERLLPVETLPGRVIDVMVWGASRPKIFRQTIESFRGHVRFTGRLRYFLEDGLFDVVKSAESVALARELGFDGVNAERVGSYGRAMTNAMNRWTRAPLMFSLEDDWLCLRNIDLDLCWDAFEQNRWMNQLKYNRRKNVLDQNDGKIKFAERKLVINGVEYPCLGGCHWYFNPAVWRMDYIRPRWCGVESNVHHYMNSSNALLPPGKRPSPDWYADVLGAITWGPVKEAAFFQHIGGGDSIHVAQGRV